MGKGLLGAVASPVSGVLDALRCDASCSHQQSLFWNGCLLRGKGAVLHSAIGLACAAAKMMFSSCLPFCSATAEGFDATFGKPKEQLLVMERRRPPRLVSGDGKLLPLVRGGSTKQVGALACWWVRLS